MADTNERIVAHYDRDGLVDDILAALEAVGKDLSALQPDDLAPLEEFHVRGRPASVELAKLAALEPDWRVLDVGCGIGGPARFLASHHGCRVSGVDLTPAYCQAATRLSQMVGLDERTDFRVADALALPFAAGHFDAAWTQHVSMNVADKAGFYGELSRVLRPGGCLAIYDVAAGAQNPVSNTTRFPLPWAADAVTSFLASPEAMCEQIETAGLTIETWQDATQPALDWFAKVEGKPAPPLGLQVLVGANWAERVANLSHNLSAGNITLVQIVARTADA